MGLDASRIAPTFLDQNPDPEPEEDMSGRDSPSESPDDPPIGNSPSISFLGSGTSAPETTSDDCDCPSCVARRARGQPAKIGLAIPTDATFDETVRTVFFTMVFEPVAEAAQAFKYAKNHEQLIGSTCVLFKEFSKAQAIASIYIKDKRQLPGELQLLLTMLKASLKGPFEQAQEHINKSKKPETPTDNEEMPPLTDSPSSSPPVETTSAAATTEETPRA